MPPRPFPFPLRVGNDVCAVGRIRDIISPNAARIPSTRQSPLERFVSKLLTWPEQRYFYHRFDSHENPRNSQKISQYLAGRWAAKEAIRKACEHLGSSNGFHSIIVLPVTADSKSSSGATSRPHALVLRDRLPELAPQELEEAMSDTVEFDVDSLDSQLCEVSISHDGHYATAVALVPVVEEWKTRAVTP